MEDKEVKTNAKKEIVQIITKMSGKYHPSVIFDDWICCMAVAIQNACFLMHNSLWHKREEQYLGIMEKYGLEERTNFPVMFQLLVDAFEDGMTDILGEIYMECECGNRNTGQFFTPFHVSKLTGGIVVPAEISEDRPLTLNEPSVGGGGMIIAVAALLKEKGINYQRCMRVTAQDIDWRSVYMAYVQFGLLGINATVVQGDSLMEPYTGRGYPEERIFRTPAKMGMMI